MLPSHAPPRSEPCMGGGGDRTNESPFRDRERGTTCVPKVFYYAEKKVRRTPQDMSAFLYFLAPTRREKRSYLEWLENFSPLVFFLSFFTARGITPNRDVRMVYKRTRRTPAFPIKIFALKRRREEGRSTVTFLAESQPPPPPQKKEIQTKTRLWVHEITSFWGAKEKGERGGC